MLTVNVVVLAGTVAADPVTRRCRRGTRSPSFALSVPETGRRLLPLPVAAWHATVGRAVLDPIAKGDSSPRLRTARPPLLPERSRGAQPHGGGRHRDQDGSSGPAEGDRGVSPRSAHGHEHQPRAGLGPEERRLAREALATRDRGHHALGSGGRQDVGGHRVARANRSLGIVRVVREAERVAGRDRGSSSSSWSARTTGGGPARVRKPNDTTPEPIPRDGTDAAPVVVGARLRAGHPGLRGLRVVRRRPPPTAAPGGREARERVDVPVSTIRARIASHGPRPLDACRSSRYASAVVYR